MCYKGFQATQGRGDNPELVRLCAASWRRRPVLRREQRKSELGDQWEELDNSMRQEVDSGEERGAWADESAERDIIIGTGTKDGAREAEDKLRGTDHQFEGRKRPRRI